MIFINRFPNSREQTCSRRTANRSSIATLRDQVWSRLGGWIAFSVGIGCQSLGDFAFQPIKDRSLIRLRQNALRHGFRIFATPSPSVLEVVLCRLADDIRAKASGQSL